MVLPRVRRGSRNECWALKPSGMATIQLPPDESAFVERALQAAIRIGLVLLLVAWCFTIVRPFVVPVVWGIIIAVATYPGFARLQAALGGRRIPAATAYVIIGLILLIVPTVLLVGRLLDTAPRIATGLSDGVLNLPPPPPGIADWPIFGDSVYRFWDLASINLQEALDSIGPQLQALGRWFLGLAGKVSLALLQFVIAIFIAAALLVNAAGGERVAGDIATRLVGARGPAFAELARSTIRSVARGIVGIALIQATLAGLGFLVVGVPAAGLLALACLFLAVAQIGPGLVLLPVVIYEFSVADTTTAVIFAIWCVFVAVLDNVLKPMLLGRGVQVPMLIIFVGAIGGLLSSGILGLFVGPVVLALGYTIFRAWLEEVREKAPS